MILNLADTKSLKSITLRFDGDIVTGHPSNPLQSDWRVITVQLSRTLESGGTVSIWSTQRIRSIT